MLFLSLFWWKFLVLFMPRYLCKSLFITDLFSFLLFVQLSRFIGSEHDPVCLLLDIQRTSIYLSYDIVFAWALTRLCEKRIRRCMHLCSFSIEMSFVIVSQMYQLCARNSDVKMSVCENIIFGHKCRCGFVHAK